LCAALTGRSGLVSEPEPPGFLVRCAHGPLGPRPRLLVADSLAYSAHPEDDALDELEPRLLVADSLAYSFGR